MLYNATWTLDQVKLKVYMDFLKTTLGKVLTGILALAVIAGAISWWRMDPADRSLILTNIGRLAGWAGIVLVAPWATFFVIGRVGKMDSNLAGGILVLMYTATELVLLLWLFDWSISGAGRWTFAIFGCLLAAVYNLLTCDWIAEKLD
jgi:hypothetical protein